MTIVNYLRVPVSPRLRVPVSYEFQSTPRRRVTPLVRTPYPLTPKLLFSPLLWFSSGLWTLDSGLHYPQVLHKHLTAVLGVANM